jgi:glycyl-tRNA synthetase (class II)
MLRRVALVRTEAMEQRFASIIIRRMVLVGTNVSVESIASIIRVKRIGELGTTLAVTINRSTLRKNTVA